MRDIKATRSILYRSQVLPVNIPEDNSTLIPSAEFHVIGEKVITDLGIEVGE